MFAQALVLIRRSLLVPILLGCCCCASVEAESNLRLHIAWGGGAERVWGGRVMLTESGTMRDLRLLGLDADEPGSIVQRGQQILVSQRRPRNYDGFEITVSAPLTAKLRVELLPAGEVKARVVEVPLEELVAGYRSESLDGENNRLVIRRAPGDFVRLRFQRDHLVFSPQEAFMLDILPHQLNVPPGTNVRCTVRLHEARSRDAVWEKVGTLRSDSRGKIPAWERCVIKIPEDEGVYELRISLTNRRLTAPLSGDKPIAKRRLQFVVVDKNVIDVVEQPRTLVLDLDPTQKNWWQRLTRLPQWTLLPGLRSEGPLGNVKAGRISQDGRAWTLLPPASWQAYPLPIDRVGAQHELEIDFPGDREQTFVVSIIEPNAAGKVIPVGLDTGVHMGHEDVAGIAVVPKSPQQHRVTFWPKTKSPLVLVTNLRQDEPAVFGKLRVHRSGTIATPSTRNETGRRAFAYFERPLFPECFGATEYRDPETGRSLEDWVTFYDGGRRMIQHLKKSGYNGVVLTCFSEGSTLYPSRLVQPTPKHDRGVFFASGQDAVRKDVLEMLFRICDREDIELVPAIEFSTPLPALERLRWQASDAIAGVDLVDENGMTWVDRNGSERGRAPYYNPVNETVQEAMLAVAREIAARYGSHPSFGGLSISMNPNGYAQLPDANWGVDTNTLKQFQSETGVGLNATVSLKNAVNRGRFRDAWLDWRTRKMTDFYGTMAAEVRRFRPDASLYLAAGRLVASKPVQRAFRPALPRKIKVEQAMSELGLDARSLDQQAGVVFLRPKLRSWNATLTQSGAEVEFNFSKDVEEYFKTSTAGTHFLHDPFRARLPSFDEVSPYGRNNTLVSLVAQISSVGDNQRRAFAQAMAAQDSRVIFSGGWMMPLGQEEFSSRFLSVFQSLPNEPFEDALREPQSSQPLRIRRLVRNGVTYLYVINDSPWQVGSTIRLQTPSPIRLESLGQARVETFQQDGNVGEWNVNLLPYDLIAVKVNGVVIVEEATVTLPQAVLPGLKDRIDSLIARAAKLRDPPSLQLLSNSSFEDARDAAGEIPGWSSPNSGPPLRLTNGEAFDGNAALRMQAGRQAAVIYSDPIAPPPSGRLSVAIRAKVLNPNQQPQVRMVLRADEKTYYPWSGIGAGHRERSLNGEWKEFVFRVSHLPPIGSEVQVGIEVSGSGEVLIDDVQLFDILALDDSEVTVLANLVTFVDYLRKEGMVSDCLRSLSGYWPQYLMKNVPVEISEVADLPVREEAVDDSEEKAGWGDRVKRFVPRLNLR